MNRKRLLAAVLAVLSSSVAWCEVGDTFTADTQEGITLEYKVTSEEDKTCVVVERVTTKSQMGETLTIPDKVNDYAVIGIAAKSVGINLSNHGIFNGCTNLRHVVLPRKMRTIAQCTFYGCAGLENVMLPDSVKVISQYIFSGCSALQQIVLPDSVIEIGNGAFKDCSVMRSISLPAKIETIGSSVFSGCTGLETVTINCSKVESWFAGMTSIKTIHLGEGVTTVVDGTKRTTGTKGAFQGCTGLEHVTFPSTLQRLADYMFRECTSLTEITLPSTLTEISSYAFNGCTSLKDITFNMPTIKSWFKGLSSLERVTFGEAVQTIEASSFYGCSSLHEITLPAGITSIGNNAFSNCNSLARVYSQIQTPYAVSAFNWNTSVLIVPQGTRVAYKSVTGWKDAVIFEEGETIYNRVYADGLGIKYTLYQNDGGEGCHYSATGHTDQLPAELTIPNNINGCPMTAIGSQAFNNCTDLTKVTLPSSLTSVSFSAFNGCTNLTEFVSQIQDPTKVTASMSSEVTARVILWVPAGTKAAYCATSGWKDFLIYEMGETVHERIVIDGQGLKYRLNQNTEDFYYSIIGYTDAIAEHITIPTEIDGVSVKNFNATFKDCTAIKWLHIPEGITYPYMSSWKDVFAGCSFVLSLDQEIVSGWSQCTFITGLELGNKVDSIGSKAFKGCTSLERVVLPTGLNRIIV